MTWIIGLEKESVVRMQVLMSPPLPPPKSTFSLERDEGEGNT